MSYWREHRRRRWCLHLRHHALTQLLDEECPPVSSTHHSPSARQVVNPDFAIACRQRLSISSAAGLRLSLALTEVVTFIGSGPECRWRFLDAGLDRRHYVLFVLDGAIYGIDLHHARRQPESAIGEWWHPRTVVRIGKLTVRPQDLAIVEPANRRDVLPLEVHWSAAGQTYSQTLQSRITLFGNSPWNTVHLTDPSVAPMQAALVRLPQSLVLVNLVDNSWTRRRGEPVSWSLLDPGDEFEIGRTAFQLAADWEENAAPAPVDLQQVV